MFSQTAEYALRAVMFLTSTDSPASCERISGEVKVPKAYLSKIMRDLVVAKIVQSNMGPNGGFTLKRSAGQITVLEVINAVDPFQRIHSCPLGRPEHVKLCTLHSKLDQSLAMMEATLNSVTLEEMAAKEKPATCPGVTPKPRKSAVSQ